ncbi:MAG: hypothetical protein LUE24_14650 [Lachnospiraceae bacterium]|nr:hypothetical protein [Lachnospiraceae bacterium]
MSDIILAAFLVAVWVAAIVGICTTPEEEQRCDPSERGCYACPFPCEDSWYKQHKGKR